MKKRCSRCDKTKDTSEFCKDEHYKLGVSSWCKSCKNEYQNEKYARNSKKIREVQYKWRHEYPDATKLTKKRAYEKRKRETGLTSYQSKEVKAKRMMIYREKNREDLRQKSRDRYYRIIKTKEGRLYWRAIVRRRLDKGSYITAEMINSIEQTNIKKYGILTCEYCKIPVGDKYHLEHKIPISRGGRSQKINLCIACPECNLSKGTLTAEEYRERLRIV